MTPTPAQAAVLRDMHEKRLYVKHDWLTDKAYLVDPTGGFVSSLPLRTFKVMERHGWITEDKSLKVLRGSPDQFFILSVKGRMAIPNEGKSVGGVGVGV